MFAWHQKNVWALALGVTVLSGQVVAQKTVSFNRDVRPILANHCFACHGPDEENRESGLRLDDREAALDYGAIVPNQPDESPLVARILSTDVDLLMPPPHHKKELTSDQKATLTRWISEGAKFDRHWAFMPLAKPTVPNSRNQQRDLTNRSQFANWPRSPIDQFTLAAMLEAGLEPAAEADKYTLVRRLYLDLIGLPPTTDEADVFVQSADPLAYEKLVTKLLDSPRYGEHWARAWLDLARYADTNGYEKDRPRSIWPYRDWVIRALNADLPYDQFSIEQLAGDMLPDPTPEQIVATGFHRNTMLNEEGGIDPLEYRYLAMVDRVATTGTVWLGLTIGCAQCHSHKFDPLSHQDYFSFMALLNNTEEPDFLIPDAEILEAQKKANQQILGWENQLEQHFPVADGVGEGTIASRRAAYLQAELEKWIQQTRPKSSHWTTIRPSKMETNLPRLEILEDGSIFSTGDVTKRDVFSLTFPIEASQLPITAIRLEAIPDDRLPERGPGRTYYEGRKGDFFVSEVSVSQNGETVKFSDASHSYSDAGEEKRKWKPESIFDGDGSTGWQPKQHKSEHLELVINLEQPITETSDLEIGLLFERHYVVSLGRFRFSITSNESPVANQIPDDVESILASSRSGHFDPNELATLKRQFLLTSELLLDARKKIENARKKLPRLPATMVMQERPPDNPRATYRHHRGEYLSPKENVLPSIPKLFLADEGNLGPANRLELARWLVSESNPLAARVAVNRAWRSFFGNGLVRTNGDFGVQSSPPSHPELLDWLAVQFVEQGWSMKQLHRLIVTSATYRQSSKISSEKLESDPQNQWLARGPRFRLTGETMRDSCLQASGKLSNKMFGPGVHPPQPTGVTELAYGNSKWTTSKGEDRYRRSIYTFKKRTAAFAAYTVFDGPSGELCVAKRNRSNTPLQALTVLNDEMYVELTGALADRTIKQKLGSRESNLAYVFRALLTRPPSKEEVDSLLQYHQEQLTRLEAGELNPEEIVSVENANSEVAALAMVARVVMNLDEAITKQ